MIQDDSLFIFGRPVLHCVGIWMHQMGPGSQKCQRLARSIVEEHLVVVSDAAAADLKDVSAIAPLFAANFMTAATEIYRVSDLVLDQAQFTN